MAINKKDQIKIYGENIENSLCIKLAELQKDIWGLSDMEVYPPWAILVVPKRGGAVLAAFDGAEPIALAILPPSISGQGEKCLHLHMVGVTKEYRSKGIAEQMLLRSKEWAVENGFSAIRWTYDPLESANANLYIGKLGAFVSKYYVDYYGELTGRDAGLPSDRFWAEWLFDKKTKTGTKEARVEIPNNFQDIKQTNMNRAKDIRLRTRKEFVRLFKEGYVIDGFVRKKNLCHYIAHNIR